MVSFNLLLFDWADTPNIVNESSRDDSEDDEDVDDGLLLLPTGPDCRSNSE
jgi:hypothetical protein